MSPKPPDFVSLSRLALVLAGTQETIYYIDESGQSKKKMTEEDPVREGAVNV